MNKRLAIKVLNHIMQNKSITLSEVMKNYQCTATDAFEIMIFSIKNQLIKEQKNGVFEVASNDEIITSHIEAIKSLLLSDTKEIWREERSQRSAFNFDEEEFDESIWDDDDSEDEDNDEDEEDTQEEYNDGFFHIIQQIKKKSRYNKNRDILDEDDDEDLD